MVGDGREFSEGSGLFDEAKEDLDDIDDVDHSLDCYHRLLAFGCLGVDFLHLYIGKLSDLL